MFKSLSENPPASNTDAKEGKDAKEVIVLKTIIILRVNRLPLQLKK